MIDDGDHVGYGADPLDPLVRRSEDSSRALRGALELTRANGITQAVLPRPLYFRCRPLRHQRG
jgi:hypothetical protein